MATVTVGKALAAHGVRGDIRFECRTDFPERIGGHPTYILRDPRTNEIMPVALSRVTLQEKSFIAGFREFAAREEAFALAKQDPRLRKAQHVAIREHLLHHYRDRLEQIQIG